MTGNGNANKIVGMGGNGMQKVILAYLYLGVGDAFDC